LSQQIDSILEPFKLQYYSALSEPTKIFEQMLNTCNQLFQIKDQTILQLKEENNQLRSRLPKQDKKENA